MNLKYKNGDMIIVINNNVTNGLKVNDKLMIVGINDNSDFIYQIRVLTGKKSGKCCGWVKEFIEENTSLIEGDD